MNDDGLDVVLNLALHPRDVPVTELNGPGRRFALWVQGCSIRCTNFCISWQALDERPKHLLTLRETLNVLSARRQQETLPIEGITFLGGEPSDQAKGLAVLARAVRSWGWSVMTYSGHTLEKLLEMESPDITTLLGHTDILIDGPFLESEMEVRLRWRGSANQRIVLLTTRYRKEEIEVLPVLKGMDITVTGDGRLVVSGSQDRDLVMRLQTALRNQGLI